MQAPVGARSSSPKNQGWALTQRRCFNTPILANEASMAVEKVVLLLENGPTWSLVTMASQLSLLAVCKFCTASEERCRWGRDWYVQTGCSGAWNSLKQSTWAQTVNFQVTTQEICMVGSYTEDLTNHRTVKIGGCALAWGWGQYGTCR